MTRHTYLYFVLTFVLGVVVGCGSLFLFALRTGKWRPPFSRERVVKTLSKDLKLSPTQVGELEKIMEENGRQHRELAARMDQQFDALREQSRNRIRQILNTDQLAKFDEIIRQHDERRRRGRRP